MDLKAGQLVSYCTWADLTNGKEVKDYFFYYLKSELSNRDLAKMLIFDAVIGNCDRHLNNFDVIITREGCQLAPIFDNGASLLAYKSDNELRMYKGIGYDCAKPFKPTHMDQVKLVKRRLVNGTLFSVDVNELYEDWIVVSEGVFSLLPDYRAKCIKNYVKHRLSFLNEFNQTVDGGSTNALNVF